MTLRRCRSSAAAAQRPPWPRAHRVRLADDECINASWVRGVRDQVQPYIATQAPCALCGW